MDQNSKIIVTGAAGFIGSYMVGYLNRKGYNNIIIVDEFSDNEKKSNYNDKKITDFVERDRLFEWLDQETGKIDPMTIEFVFHLGARTDTTEFDYSIHEKWNVEYSKKIWRYCTEKNVPLIYASSAATYGSGELGYKDDHDIIDQLKPLNPYGVSKNEFDKWALRQDQGKQPPFWAGLKFFNVYGPNEYHKGRMASVIFHSYNQIKETGKVKLFRSHKPQYKNGEQLRDFIHVDDVAAIMYWMMEVVSRESSPDSYRVVSRQSETSLTSHVSRLPNGIYNVGTGKARTFKDLVTAIFTSLNLKPEIEFIDTPEDIREKYQYFTEADMIKLRSAGYDKKFFTLEEGVGGYVKNFLLAHKYY
jgi:ADP-L-glycero-D-manno-heptose 6-epimerase